MKIILTILSCVFSIVFFAQDQNSNNEVLLNAHSDFGRHSVDCKGRGLCSFTKESNSNYPVNSSIVYTSNSFQLTIYRDQITPEEEIKIVGHRLTEHSNTDQLIFVMPEDFELSDILEANSNNSQFASISKGVYPLEVTAETFTITFNLE